MINVDSRLNVSKSMDTIEDPWESSAPRTSKYNRLDNVDLRVVNTVQVEVGNEAEVKEESDDLDGIEPMQQEMGVHCTLLGRFSIENLENDPKRVQYYTSFRDYEHFMLFFNCLGPAVNELNYQCLSLTPKDQLFNEVTSEQRRFRIKNAENLLAAKLYILKTDFKAHIKQKDKCADHCISFALSDPMDQKHQQLCSDHIHDTSCDRCDLFTNTVLEVKNQIRNLGDELPPDLLSDIYGDIESACERITDWKRHIVRTINQDKGRSDLLKSLSPEQAVIVMDWAMKFLPMSFREKQSDWFGQKGVNWHVSHRTFAHCVEATKQDWYTVSALLEHTLQTIKSQLPNIKTVFLRSDNAGCYHCGNLWFSIPFISERTVFSEGVYIKRYDFSEAQSGKSYCNAKIAHKRGKSDSAFQMEKNVVCASDINSAIDDYGGVSGWQAAHVEITNTLDDHRATGLIKGISNIEFQENMQITMWKAYGIGQGRNISVQGQMNSQDERLVEGSIKQSSAGDGFSCQEGCVQTFTSFMDMHMHCLIGDHNYDLQQMSTYDKIKLRWYDACINLSEILNFNRTDASQPNISQDIAKEQQGWALKKERKHVRFSDKVKLYLKSIFEDGERVGTR
ncbi:unnamed protein product [Mytilus edulis]|uniref:C2H2-type domain-containing protein n=1 Tax=Mytilus edulis TaxID=6550 RepID=A0A8S3VGJ0_MYTED|nr:unnamed protein product [Mytilus edulis]